MTNRIYQHTDYTEDDFVANNPALLQASIDAHVRTYLDNYDRAMTNYKAALNMNDRTGADIWATAIREYTNNLAIIRSVVQHADEIDKG